MRQFFVTPISRLIREDNQALDKTFIYSYNEIGNVSKVKEYPYVTEAVFGMPVTTSYTYGDSTHPDRLTNFGGSAIYYDSMGYPTSYGSHRFTWDKGKLTRVHRGSAQQPGSLYTDCKFTYDAYGRRLSKSYTHDPNPASTSDDSYTYNTTYNYDNSGRLIREYCIEQYISGITITREFIYLYDESSIVGVLYSYNGSTPTPYYYHRNLQGDVIAIYDASGNVKAGYAYDAWGNCTVTNSTLYDLAYNNPIRYRGYYYDRETGLYYLNARYYNPEWRRFISPDSTAYLDPESANGLNLYAYCYNDPVNYADPSGCGAVASFLVGLGISAAIGAIVGAGFYAAGQGINYLVTGKWEWSWGGFIGSAIGDALGGMFVFAFTAIGAPHIGNALSGFISSISFMLGMNISGDAEYTFYEMIGTSVISGFLSVLSLGIADNIKIPVLNAGRGNFSSISSQIYTKFNNGTISKIRFQTFAKMLAVEVYNSIINLLVENEYSQNSRNTSLPY